MSMNSLYKFVQNRLFMHLIYWVSFVIVGSFLFSYQQNFPYSFYLLNFIVHLPVFVLFTYTVIYKLVPAFLFKKRYLYFFLSLILVASVAAICRIFISKYIYYALFIPQILHPKEWLSIDVFLLNLLWILGQTVLFAMFKYYKNWVDTQNLANEAESKRMASELQVLKAQLNPHFLFNTFNNLYMLALQKSDKTPVMISKMSDLFHYILYECNAIEVPVSKEIKLIEDYIQLEELRYADRLSISFQKPLENQDYLIPPMLLYTFVENCFKHGCSPDPGSPWIRLAIRINQDKFEFEASNSIPQSHCKNNQFVGGVGLNNIKRRLELIYPQKHQLEIRKENCQFDVRLVITKNNFKNQEIDA